MVDIFTQFKKNLNKLKIDLDKNVIENPAHYHTLSEEEKDNCLANMAWLAAQGMEFKVNEQPLLDKFIVMQLRELKKIAEENIDEKYADEEDSSLEMDNGSLKDEIEQEFKRLVKLSSRENPENAAYFLQNSGATVFDSIKDSFGDATKDRGVVVTHELYKLFRENGIIGAGERSFNQFLKQNPYIVTDDTKPQPAIQTSINFTFNQAGDEIHLHEQNQLMSYSVRDVDTYELDNIGKPYAQAETEYHLKTEGQQLAYLNTETAVETYHDFTSQVIDKRNWLEKMIDSIKSILFDNGLPEFSPSGKEHNNEPPQLK